MIKRYKSSFSGVTIDPSQLTFVVGNLTGNGPKTRFTTYEGEVSNVEISNVVFGETGMSPEGAYSFDYFFDAEESSTYAVKSTQGMPQELVQGAFSAQEVFSLMYQTYDDQSAGAFLTEPSNVVINIDPSTRNWSVWGNTTPEGSEFANFVEIGDIGTLSSIDNGDGTWQIIYKFAYDYPSNYSNFQVRSSGGSELDANFSLPVTSAFVDYTAYADVSYEGEVFPELTWILTISQGGMSFDSPITGSMNAVLNSPGDWSLQFNYSAPSSLQIADNVFTAYAFYGTENQVAIVSNVVPILFVETTTTTTTEEPTTTTTTTTESQNIWDAVTQDGLVLHFDINSPDCYDGSSTLSDLSKGGNTGNIVNASFDSEGSSLFFNSNGYVATTYQIPIMDENNDFTWDIWLNVLDRTSGAGVLIGKRYFAEQLGNIKFIKLTQNDLQYYADNSSSSSISNNITANSWVNVCIVKSGSYLKYYFNNSIVGTTGIIASDIQIPFYIGGDPINGEYTRSKISVVRVYDRELSESEISQNYNITLPRYQSIETTTTTTTETPTTTTTTTIDQSIPQFVPTSSTYASSIINSLESKKTDYILTKIVFNTETLQKWFDKNRASKTDFISLSLTYPSGSPSYVCQIINSEGKVVNSEYSLNLGNWPGLPIGEYKVEIKHIEIDERVFNTLDTFIMLVSDETTTTTTTEKPISEYTLTFKTLEYGDFKPTGEPLSVELFEENFAYLKDYINYLENEVNLSQKSLDELEKTKNDLESRVEKLEGGGTTTTTTTTEEPTTTTTTTEEPTTTTTTTEVVGYDEWMRAQYEHDEFSIIPEIQHFKVTILGYAPLEGEFFSHTPSGISVIKTLMDKFYLHIEDSITELDFIKSALYREIINASGIIQISFLYNISPGMDADSPGTYSEFQSTITQMRKMEIIQNITTQNDTTGDFIGYRNNLDRYENLGTLISGKLPNRISGGVEFGHYFFEDSSENYLSISAPYGVSGLEVVGNSIINVDNQVFNSSGTRIPYDGGWYLDPVSYVLKYYTLVEM